MASGVETRMPFMDWRLVCKSFSLPSSSKIGVGYTKRILRDSVNNILIDEVRLRRTKIGWNAPIHDWIKGFLKPQIENILYKNKTSKYYKASKKAFDIFNKKSKSNFYDGQDLWVSILPLVWESSLGNKIWK